MNATAKFLVVKFIWRIQLIFSCMDWKILLVPYVLCVVIEWFIFLFSVGMLPFCRNTSNDWKKRRSMTIDCWVQSRSFSSAIHLGALSFFIYLFIYVYFPGLVWSYLFMQTVLIFMFLLYISAQEVGSSFHLEHEFTTNWRSLYAINIEREDTKRLAFSFWAVMAMI